MSAAPDRNLQDRPISSAEEDRLDRGAFVENLLRALIERQMDEDGQTVSCRATGFVVGLTGPWGLGKSSVLHLVRERLEREDKVIVAYFNPWLFKGRDELILGFFGALRSAMGRDRAGRFKALVEPLKRYQGAILFPTRVAALFADLHGAGGLATATVNRASDAVTGLWPDENSPDAEAERAALEKALAESDVAVVVLIDELDRVEDDEVRAVAQLVKAIGEIKGISYLVAYDPERVADALGRGEGAERRSSGQAYLEKIIHLPIPLRPLEREDIEALLHQALTAHAKPLPARTKHYQSAILEQILQQIETPRDVKRLTQSFAVFETIVKGDICPYDVMAYCWLIIKFPSAHKIIRENLHYLVFDPESQMQIKQYLRKLDGKAEPTLMGIFTPDYAAYEPLLQQLFPHFSKSISDRDEGFMLAKRRNLRRMLYLGNPPGQIPRAEIESLWNAPDANEIKRRLDDYVASGKIMDVLERLPDLSDRLLESHDIEFWKHLADLLYRKTDWITAQQPFAQIAREAAEAMRLMAWRDRPGSPRHLNCIMSLQRSGDLILVPQLLYWNIRAHRLDARAGHQDERETLSEDITARLIADEVPRYRSAVLNGTVLRRLPTLDVVFALMQAGAWDEEMRLSLNSQLTDFTSIATFAALLFPPGFGEPFETLNDIVVVHDLDLKTRTLEMPSDHAGDSWLWASVKRLKAVIAREVSSA